MIQRDIARTFPAHDFFKEAGGLGQDSLYRVSKAYAVYDAEVGYCQGLSFLAATLLLHVSYFLAFINIDMKCCSQFTELANKLGVSVPVTLVLSYFICLCICLSE